MNRGLSYRDAITALGGDPPTVAAIDRALGGALSIATGGVSDTVLDVFGTQPHFIGVGRKLVSRIREGGIRNADRVERTRRLEAAFVVIAVTAYFEALDTLILPFKLSDLNLTGDEQLRIATGPTGPDLLESVLLSPPPQPAPHMPLERLLEELGQWYRQVSLRLINFLHGLSVWESISETQQEHAENSVSSNLCSLAIDRFSALHRKLILDVPEFRYWSYEMEHQATRAEIRWALGSLTAILDNLKTPSDPFEIVSALTTAYQAELSRPILSDGAAHMPMPTLHESYIDPDFRVRALTGGENPADEDGWSRVQTRSDLSEYLAGVLTSTGATLAPVVVLGQPGAGKSALTKVLAARLPAGDFAPVRVVLREVNAESDVQDQLEYAIREATGQRIDWITFVRETRGTKPVLLFDGFDELLQATGVSQSDYLLRVARFQEREAQQGRPVATIVTSRSAVSDRVRYPPGVVVLSLQPFSKEQVEAWVARWNRHHDPYYRRTSVAPLDIDVVQRQSELARQPLLLLMLALYDAESNALSLLTQEDSSRPIDESTLYERLLSAFASREIDKLSPTVEPEHVSRQIESELQQLSLIALGMINRRRQWITEQELDADLAAILGPFKSADHDFRQRQTRAQAGLGRFFFVQRAQAIRGGTRLQTFEFLHATFGEYLAARLAVQLTARIADQQPALSISSMHVEDDLLYSLFSFAPLSSRQQLRFVRGCVDRTVQSDDRKMLRTPLVMALTQSEQRSDNRYADYRPAAQSVASRHGIYSANLVLLTLVFAGTVTASALFPDSLDPAGTWRQRTLLWRSAMSEGEWTDLALAMTVRKTWSPTRRELEISLTTEDIANPSPVDLYWHFRYPPGHESRGNITWRRTYVSEIVHKMHVAGGTNDSTVLHALEPLLERLGATTMTFMGLGETPPSSFAHDLIRLWLASALGNESELRASYLRCTRVIDALHIWGPEFRDVVVIILKLMAVDAPRLPHEDIKNLLAAALTYADEINDTAAPIYQLVTDCAHALHSQAIGDADEALDEIVQIGASAGEGLNQLNQT